MTPSKLLLAFAVVGALAFTAGRLTRGDLSSEPSTVRADAIGTASTQPDSVAGTILDEVAARGVERVSLDRPEPGSPGASQVFPDEPSMEEALAALDRAIRLRPIYDEFDEGFAAKYAGASAEALLQARELVRSRMNVAQNSIAKDRLAMGLFETAVVADGDPPTAFKGRKGRTGPTIISGFNEPPAGGSYITRTVEIDPAEYPEFNAVVMEYRWLKRKLRPPVLATEK